MQHLVHEGEDGKLPSKIAIAGIAPQAAPLVTLDVCMIPVRVDVMVLYCKLKNMMGNGVVPMGPSELARGKLILGGKFAISTNQPNLRHRRKLATKTSKAGADGQLGLGETLLQHTLRQTRGCPPGHRPGNIDVRILGQALKG